MRLLLGQTSDRLPFGENQIPLVLTAGLLMAQVVISFHQAVEQRLLGCATHLLKL